MLPEHEESNACRPLDASSARGVMDDGVNNCFVLFDVRCIAGGASVSGRIRKFVYKPRVICD